MRGVCLITLFLMCTEARVMVTFHERNPCERAASMPTCATMVKCYSTRLLINVDACDIASSDMSTWIAQVFVSSTVHSVEEDYRLHPTSLDPAVWGDREWVVSQPYGMSPPTGLQSSNETVVAVLDSGLPLVSLGMFASLLDGYDFVSDVSIANDGDGRDSVWHDPGDATTWCPGANSWHGLRVAAVIAGAHSDFEGVATNTMILPVRVLGACQSGYASDVADAIVWASGGSIDHIASNPTPAHIISMSFAGEGNCPSYVQSAVDQAISKGYTLLAAAGNSAESTANYFPGLYCIPLLVCL
jgi:serine protease